jgi:hypothetical protein
LANVRRPGARRDIAIKAGGAVISHIVQGITDISVAYIQARSWGKKRVPAGAKHRGKLVAGH